LAMRCEQLGYQFDRRALDDIYRRFVRLADKIKHVEDHHLLELIRDTRKTGGSVTPLIEPIQPDKAAAADVALRSSNAAGNPESLPKAIPPSRADAFPSGVPAEGHHDQEDYLWGV